MRQARAQIKALLRAQNGAEEVGQGKPASPRPRAAQLRICGGRRGSRTAPGTGNRRLRGQAEQSRVSPGGRRVPLREALGKAARRERRAALRCVSGPAPPPAESLPEGKLWRSQLSGAGKAQPGRAAGTAGARGIRGQPGQAEWHRQGRFAGRCWSLQYSQLSDGTLGDHGVVGEVGNHRGSPWRRPPCPAARGAQPHAAALPRRAPTAPPPTAQERPRGGGGEGRRDRLGPAPPRARTWRRGRIPRSGPRFGRRLPRERGDAAAPV